jgi:TRAP-type C4-dicarboxylate transport system substrate-binding protein
MKRASWFALTVIASTIGGSATAAEVTLRAAAFLPPTVNFGEPFKRFVDKVNADGKGIVQIRAVGGPEAVPPFEQGNAVKTGVLDMAAIPPAYYKTHLVEGDAQTLSNLTFTEQRKSGAWTLLNKLHTEKLNAWYLAAYGDSVKFHIYLTKPVDKADLKGFKLRSSPNYQAFFQQLGATTVITPPGEVYTALERGIIDGYGWPLWGIHDQGWDKFTKFRIDPGFYLVAVNILVNLQKWNGLAPEQRDFLTKTAAWFEGEDFPRWSADRNALEAKKQSDSGVKIIDLGPEFAKKAEAVYWDELAKASPDNIAKLRQVLVK